MSIFSDSPEGGIPPERRSLPSSESIDQIIWTDREDVYKPIPQLIEEFTKQRSIPQHKYKEVYFSEKALTTLTRHLDSNPHVEQGGILFGNAYQDPRFGIYVEITAAIPAPATIGTVAHLEFTPDSWLSIMDYARAQHSTENVVGWYHSHPNHGVFMSSVDMRTQTAFFSHDWCLSVVCDPIRREIGYFLGKNARRVEPLRFHSSSPLNFLPSSSDSLDRPQSPEEANYLRIDNSDRHNRQAIRRSRNTFEDKISLIKKFSLKLRSFLLKLTPIMTLAIMLWNAMLLGLNQLYLSSEKFRYAKPLNLKDYENILRDCNSVSIWLNIFMFIFFLLLFPVAKKRK